MQRISIARAFRLALIGLTLALVVVAGVGVASLYNSRRSYEATLTRSASLAIEAANLSAAGVTEAEVLRDVQGPSAPAARQRAADLYRQAAAVAAVLARPDPPSSRLVHDEVGAQARARALAAAGQLAAAIASGGPLATAQRFATALERRQQVRQATAQRRAHTDSRHAILLVVIAAVLALIAALSLIAALVSSMRRPLDALVAATRDLTSGQFERRVTPAGPRELQDLGVAFNAMGDALAGAQGRIEEERRRLEATIESLGDALIVTEPGSKRIAAVNPRATDLVPELKVGVEVDSRESPLPPLGAALLSETAIEHRGLYLAVTAARLGTEADGVVWTVRDMSERARLERAKTEFVATASHELRSPLTSIKGFVELLARSPENMSERQREFVEIILRSADRLVELVGDLLDVARIDADHVELDLRPIDVGEAVREVAELLGPRIAEKKQMLGIYVAPTLPLALADAGRVRQIVANLLTNAHQYTDEGGRIHIGVEPDRAWVQLVVADSGTGMTADETERIFDRFYRVPDGGRASASPGTGLGLSIVKSLVDLHHGKIEVDSEPGRGTTFRVLLPAATVGADKGASLEVIRGRRVLIVDDERDIAELIADQLAPLEVQTSIALSGAEALALLHSERFDAITLDILMPGRDGFDVLREIRADSELRSTPIVFVSVFSGHPNLAGEWTVSKPIDADELREVLSAAVRAGRSRVLVVGRSEMQPVLEPALDDLGIEHDWEMSGAAAARVCGERRFEVALIDVGVRNPQAVLQALDLRGRRLRRAVILFGDERTPTPPGIGKLGIEVVPVDQAAPALLAALRDESLSS
jgi:signal transduction histidine kinase/DNA-binding NarL/FixJ family response regulator